MKREGDLEANLDAAIRAGESALRDFDEQNRDWAAMSINLAHCYRRRARWYGDADISAARRHLEEVLNSPVGKEVTQIRNAAQQLLELISSTASTPESRLAAAPAPI